MSVNHFLLGMMLCFSISGYAQEKIGVLDFHLDHDDLTAMQQGTTVYDQNGERCALIKIYTQETGFTFDVGSLGIREIKYLTGQIWLYIPYGARKISIYHQKLGNLIDYEFPVSIQKGRTYEMSLSTNKIFVNNYDDSRKQTLSIKVTPANATFILNGVNLPLDSNGTAEQELSFGVYTYKVDAYGYYPKSGQITIDDTAHVQKFEVNDLKPIMGSLEITSVPAEANVMIDGKPMGQTPRLLLKELSVGSHRVHISKENYQSEIREIEINSDNVAQLSVELTPTCVFIIDTNPSHAPMTFDGKDVGYSPYSSEMTSGDYDVTVKMKGYYDYRKRLHLDSSQPNVLLPLKREHFKDNNYYVGGGLQIGGMMAAGGIIGAYINKINVEAVCLFGISSSQNIFWNRVESESDVSTCYSYKSNYFGANFGYGLNLGHYFRITPKAGVGILKLKGTMKHYDECGYLPQNTDAIILKGGCNFEYAVTPWLAIFIKPEYSMAIKKKSLFNKISESSLKVKRFATGFNAMVGVYFYL